MHYAPERKLSTTEIMQEALQEYGLEPKDAHFCIQRMISTLGQATFDQWAFKTQDDPNGVADVIQGCTVKGWLDENLKTPVTKSPMQQKTHGNNVRQINQNQTGSNENNNTQGQPRNAAGKQKQFNQVKVFSRNTALTVSLYTNKDTNEIENIGLAFAQPQQGAPKVNGMQPYDWEKAERFALSGTEAVGLLLVLQGIRPALMNVAGKVEEGLYHQSNNVHKRVDANINDDGKSIYLKITSTPKGGKPNTIGLPIGAGDRLLLSAYLSANIKQMHPFVGLTALEIITMARNTLN